MPPSDAPTPRCFWFTGFPAAGKTTLAHALHARLRSLLQPSTVLDGDELLDEGRNMRHCVSTYGPTCCRGNSSIWSMTCSDSREQNRRELTIEVDPRRKAIIQARGVRNSRPTPEARRIMLLWAEREGLKVESWV